MSVDHVTAELDRLIFNSDDADAIVVAIKGRWGEGKTHFWKNKVMEERPAAKNSYVSVFGADSLKEIRRRVLLARVPRGIRGIAEILGGIADKAGNAIGIGDVSSAMPESLQTTLLERFMFKAGMVICLDDVERMSDKIHQEEFLGFLSELRDELRMKVVLIYNACEGSGNDTFRLYQEKVIDREIEFSPDLHNVIRLAFCDSQLGQDQTVMAELVRRCATLGFRNVRLLLKAKRYFNDVAKTGACQDAAALASMLYSIVLFVFVSLGRDRPEALTLSFIRNMSDWDSLLPVDSECEDDDSPAGIAAKLLAEYGYRHTDEVDKVLLDFVETDILDIEKLLEHLGDSPWRAQRKRTEERISEIWRTHLHATLRDTSAEFANELQVAALESMPMISIAMLDQVLSMLVRLGRAQDAAAVFSEFRRVRGDSLVSAETLRRIEYQPLKEQLLHELEAAALDNRSIREVLCSVAQLRRIVARDKRRLCQFGVDALLEYFLTEHDPVLLTKLKLLVRAAEALGSADQFDVALRRMARKLPKLIAARSPMNVLRVRAVDLGDYLDKSTEDTVVNLPPSPPCRRDGPSDRRHGTR